MTSADHLSSVQRFVIACLSDEATSSIFFARSSMRALSSGGIAAPWAARRSLRIAIILSTPLPIASAHWDVELFLQPGSSAAASTTASVVFMRATFAQNRSGNEKGPHEADPLKPS